MSLQTGRSSASHLNPSGKKLSQRPEKNQTKHSYSCRPAKTLCYFTLYIYSYILLYLVIFNSLCRYSQSAACQQTYCILNPPYLFILALATAALHTDFILGPSYVGRDDSLLLLCASFPLPAILIRQHGWRLHRGRPLIFYRWRTLNGSETNITLRSTFGNVATR